MSISINNVLNSHDINELKAQGSFLELKQFTENQLSLKLKVRGWVSLFNKIKHLQGTTPKNRDTILNIISNYPLPHAEKQIEKLIAVKFNTADSKQLTSHFLLLCKAFKKANFDPYQRFEETKRKNFQHSSRLEGVKIAVTPKSSLEAVLAKYQRSANG